MLRFPVWRLALLQAESLIFFGYAKIAAVVFAGLAIQILFFNVGPLFVAGISPRALWNAVQGAVVIAFSTASGAVAIPEGVRGLESISVPSPIATFVFGAQAFNLAGSSIYVGAATVFILQASGWTLHGEQWFRSSASCMVAL